MSSRPPRPRTRLGQHFLTDHNIVRKILDLAAVGPSETVFEIGPGRGALTRALCERARRVVAVEVDPDLHRWLEDRLSDCPALELHCGDALRFPFHELPPGTVVVANLPYYLSTPLLFALIEARARFARLIVMLQAEVAKRIVAQPGTADYGVLSVLLQCWTAPTLAFRVRRTCFRPQPEVDSAVVRLDVRPAPAVAIRDDRGFSQVVRAAFAHRRKTVLNSLRDEGLAADVAQRALAEAGVDPGRRAETMTLQEFGLLSEALSGPCAAGQTQGILRG